MNAWSETIFDSLLIVVGLGLFLLGSKWLVDGASQLSIALGVSPFVVGLTVVAFGSSAPEAALAVTAVSAESGAIALGNVVGSNIANIGILLGISALACPVLLRERTMGLELIFMVAAMILLMILAIDGLYSRLEGIFLVGLIIIFLLLMYLTLVRFAPPSYQTEREFAREIMPKRRRAFNALMLLVVLLFLVLGAQAIISGAIELAESLEVDGLIIGLTTVALGTSLPEFPVSITAACKNEPGIVLSNIVGSNIFNSLFVIGLASGLNPIIVPPEMLLLEMPLMILLGVLLLVVIWLWKSIYRATGVMLIVIYLIYLILLAQRSGVF